MPNVSMIDGHIDEIKKTKYIDVSKIKFSGQTFIGENDEVYIKFSDVVRAVEQTPSEDVKKEIHARWKISFDGYYPYCSHCLEEPKGRMMTKYCAECGAIMDEEEIKRYEHQKV